MEKKLYKVVGTVDNGWTKEKWETFCFANCKNTARWIVSQYYEKQSRETVMYDIVCEEVDCANLDIICSRRLNW